MHLKKLESVHLLPVNDLCVDLPVQSIVEVGTMRFTGLVVHYKAKCIRAPDDRRYLKQNRCNNAAINNQVIIDSLINHVKLLLRTKF